LLQQLQTFAASTNEQLHTIPKFDRQFFYRSDHYVNAASFPSDVAEIAQSQIGNGMAIYQGRQGCLRFRKVGLRILGKRVAMGYGHVPHPHAPAGALQPPLKDFVSDGADVVKSAEDLARLKVKRQQEEIGCWS